MKIKCFKILPNVLLKEKKKKRFRLKGIKASEEKKEMWNRVQTEQKRKWGKIDCTN